MHATNTARPVRRRTSSARALVALAAVPILLCAYVLVTSLPAGASGAPSVTVRIEGPGGTLVPATAVTLSAGRVVKDGIAADSCSGLSAAGALQLATHGRWTGVWSKSLKGYFVAAID